MVCQVPACKASLATVFCRACDCTLNIRSPTVQLHDKAWQIGGGQGMVKRAHLRMVRADIAAWNWDSCCLSWSSCSASWCTAACQSPAHVNLTV